MDIDSVQHQQWPTGQVGFVALIGRPNTGKSTFLNTVLDFHLAAVSRQPQTTRRHGLGIYSNQSSQILFLDAPGIHIPQDMLGEAMIAAIQRTFEDADVLLCIADPTRPPGEEDQLVAQRVAHAKVPAILGINKSDAASKEEIATTKQFYQQVLGAVETHVFSATKRETLGAVLEALRSRLPNGPFLYSPDDVTDEYARDIAAELIREVCLSILRQEVPHALAVTVDSWDESTQPVRIEATIHVERTSQKKIVIGKGGRMIKKIRTRAEQTLLELDPAGVSLRLWVKVSRDWRSRRDMLRDLGLLGQT